MAVKTLSNALGLLYTERRNFYVSPNEVRELWTDVAPFTTIISNRGTKNVPDPDFKMFEHRSGWIRQRFFAAGAPAAWSGGTGAAGETIAAMAIDNILGLASVADSSWKGLVCEVYNTGQTVYKGIVLIVASATTLTIKSLGNPRAADSLCAALADNDEFEVIGTAFGEGTKAPDAWADEIEVVYNSCQIFKTSIEITGTLYQAALRGYSSELERLRVEKNKEHKMQKERAFLYGVRVGGTGMTDLKADNAVADSHGGSSAGHTTDADGNLVRTTMGIIPTIYRYGTDDTSSDKQNIFSISQATYKYASFVDDMEKVFQYLPDDGTKIALCGAGALSYWSKVDGAAGFVKNSGFSVQLDSMQRDSLGFNFRTLVTPHGLLKLVYAPALKGAYRNTMLVIEPADLEFVQYRAPVFKANIKTDDDYDGVKDEYKSDEGIGVTLVEKHSIFNVVA